MRRNEMSLIVVRLFTTTAANGRMMRRPERPRKGTKRRKVVHFNLVLAIEVQRLLSRLVSDFLHATNTS